MFEKLLTALLWPLRMVFDPRVSPLRHLRPAQRFQVMCLLGMMWTTFFCLGLGIWYLYGELIVFHVLMAAGTLVTGLSFRSAAAKNNRSS